MKKKLKLHHSNKTFKKLIFVSEAKRDIQYIVVLHYFVFFFHPPYVDFSRPTLVHYTFHLWSDCFHWKSRLCFHPWTNLFARVWIGSVLYCDCWNHWFCRTSRSCSHQQSWKSCHRISSHGINRYYHCFSNTIPHFSGKKINLLFTKLTKFLWH